jgi:hypothetical protein
MSDLVHVLQGSPARYKSVLRSTGNGVFRSSARGGPLELAVSDGNNVAPSNWRDVVGGYGWLDNLSEEPVVSAVGPKSLKLSGDLIDSESEYFGHRVAAHVVRRAVPKMEPIQISASAPVGVWEGEITDVDSKGKMFSARLVPLRGSDVDVSGDISFEQINPEDVELVVPGAVFYLEIFRRYVKRQLSYSQQVRFRRLPSWTSDMVQRVSEIARELRGSEIKSRISD